MRGASAIGLAAIALAACGGDDAGAADGPRGDGAATPDAATPDAAMFVPGPSTSLSDSPANDEDPFVLRSVTGWYYVIWFSDRTGRGDLYMRRTRDGVTWSDPVQVTSGSDLDLYPSLYEDPARNLYATWFRRVATDSDRGHIVVTATADPLVWDPAREETVTTPTGADNDWTPTIAATPGLQLSIAFARDGCFPTPQPCFSAKVTSLVGGVWSAPVPLADATGVQDHLPFITGYGGGLLAAWNRYDAAATLPYVTTTTDVLTSTSADGAAWTAPVELTANDAQMIVDVFPTIFVDHGGEYRVMWLAASPTAIAVVDRPFLGSPGDESPIAALPPTGYSHHVVATSTPDVYLAAWVEGPDTAREIYVKVFAR